MHTWVFGIFGLKFRSKIAPRSSRLVLGVRSHGPTGIKMGSLWIRFPVWRELKLKIWSGTRLIKFIDFGSAFPFEGNWNSISKILKCSPLCFGSAFPFEGNWNSISKILKCSPLCFGSAFPFEGNWNEIDGSIWIIPEAPLWIRFPVWRELKHNANRVECNIGGLTFGYAFPFEGNWNFLKISNFTKLEAEYFGYAFPFEWNWNNLPGNWLISFGLWLWICFPVWRELKQKLEYNHHKFYPLTLDMLSRLKGIETVTISNDV